MKSRSLILTGVLLASASWTSMAQKHDSRGDHGDRGALLPPGARVGITVLDGSGGNQVDRVVGDMLTTALRRAGIRVIERPAIDAIAREQALARNGIVDPSTAAPSGKVLGVDYLLGVKATEFGVKDDRIGGAIALGPVAGLQVRTSTARVVLDARLIETGSGVVATTETAEGKQVHQGGTILGGYISGRVINLGGIDIGSKEWSESTLGKAARKAVDSLVKKLALTQNAGDGLVLAVTPSGETVIGLGGFDGLRADDVLDLVRLNVVRDSKGKAVWTDERTVGKVRVTEVRGDRAKARPEGDASPQEGDIVRAVRQRKAERTDRSQEP